MSKSNKIKVKQHKAGSNPNDTNIALTSITNPVSGLTIVFARIGARMVGVSLAWCAPEDKFSRKKGVKMAVRPIIDVDDFAFQVPMPGATNEQIVWHLTSIFHDVNFDKFHKSGAKGIYRQNEQ